MSAPTNDNRPLTAVALACSLKPIPAESWGHPRPKGRGIAH